MTSSPTTIGVSTHRPVKCTIRVPGGLKALVMRVLAGEPVILPKRWLFGTKNACGIALHCMARYCGGRVSVKSLSTGGMLVHRRDNA